MHTASSHAFSQPSYSKTSSEWETITYSSRPQLIRGVY